MVVTGSRSGAAVETLVDLSGNVPINSISTAKVRLAPRR
jgi:hypothetical protein